MGNLSLTFNTPRDIHPGSITATRSLSDATGDAPTRLSAALRRMNLLTSGDHPHRLAIKPSLAGRAHVERVDLGWGTLCVKSVPDDAPPASRSRIAAEGAWLRLARSVVGEAVPEVRGEDAGVLAMEYLEPALHRGWLETILQGEVSPSTAAEVGRLLGRTHAATANNMAIAARFAGNAEALEARLAPALVAATDAMPGVTKHLERIAMALATTRIALIHGDARPENILLGPRGPVLVAAEYAAYGDPAFDAATTLAALLTVAAARPFLRARCMTAFDAFCAAYAQRITWELPEHTDERAARLLPALLLEAAHGEVSPWLQDLRTRSLIVAMARTLLVDPAPRLAAAREFWRRALLG